MAFSLWIPDTSPLFFYSPAPAYFSGWSNTASWTAANDTNSTSQYPTFHSTAGPASAVILPFFYLSAFTPFWGKSALFAVELGVDSSDPTDIQTGTTHNQTFGQNSFELSVHCNAVPAQCASSPLQFRGATVVTQVVPSGAATINVTIDDASPAIQYNGFAAVTTGAAVAVSAEDYDGTLSSTSTANASATVDFNAASILLKGITSPSLGPYAVTLDGVTSTYSASSNITSHAVPLFFATNLDTSKAHNLVLTALDGGEGGTGVVLDEMIIWGTSGAVGFIGSVNGATTTIGPGAAAATGTATPATADTATNTSAVATGISNAATGGGSPNAGTIIGAILGTLAGLGLLYFLFRKAAPALKKKSDKKLNPWDQANLLQNMKNENVHITTVANQRYVYPGLIAHSELKK